MTDSNDHMNGEDGADERALREGLRAPALSAEAMRRIRAATEAQWRAEHPKTSLGAPARRRFSIAAAAAGVLFAAAMSWKFFLAAVPGDGAVLGQLARTDAPGVVETRSLRPDLVLAEGTSLREGQKLDVRGNSLVALATAGNLRIARASAVDVTGGNAVELERGELYVDIPPDARGSDRFVVITPAGEFRHVGTQFSVALFNGTTRLRVREGSVQWHATQGDSTVNAGTEVVIDRDNTVTRRPIARAGREWTWTEPMAPDIQIENRPLKEFLEWFARETGRKLELADDGVRQQASTILMHGDVRGLSALEALSAVMASTTLRFELPEGVIRVSSAGAPKTPST